MNFEMLGNIGEFISSIVVLITLVYVAIQVRQTRNATLASMMQANRVEIREFQSRLRDAPDVLAIAMKAEKGEVLSEFETRRLATHCGVVVSLLYSIYVQRQLVDDKRFLTTDDVWMELVARGYGGHAKLWWERTGSRVYPEEFVSYVNGRIAGFEK